MSSEDIEILRFWIRVVVVIAAAATTSFPIIYSFSPWVRRPIGRVMMLQGVSFALAMDLTVLFMFWRPSSIMVIFLVNAVVLSLIALSTSSLTFLVWKLNHPTRRKRFLMKFTSPVYDVLKKIAQIWLPAAGTLYFSLAQIWHLPAPEEVGGTVLAVDTFLGVLLGISTKTYNDSDERFGGTLEVKEGEDSSTLHLKGVDPVALVTRPEVVFKIIHS